jgi:hypothetical protein
LFPGGYFVILRQDNFEDIESDEFRKALRRGIQFYEPDEVKELIKGFSENPGIVLMTIQVNSLFREGNDILCDYFAVTFYCGKEAYRIEKGVKYSFIKYSLYLEGDCEECKMEDVPAHYHKVSDGIENILLSEKLLISPQT